MYKMARVYCFSGVRFQLQVTADVKMQLEALGEELESQKELTIVSKSGF